MNTKRTIWWRVRWICYTIQIVGCLISVILSPSNSTEQSGPFDFTFFIISTVAIVIFFIAIPFLIAGIISFQAINPFSATMWRKPTHNTNPFTLTDPLQFFHFFGFEVLFSGVGLVLGSLFAHFNSLGDGFGCLFAGLGVIGGVHLAMRWCHQKIEKSNEVA